MGRQLDVIAADDCLSTLMAHNCASNHCCALSFGGGGALYGDMVCLMSVVVVTTAIRNKETLIVIGVIIRGCVALYSGSEFSLFNCFCMSLSEVRVFLPHDNLLESPHAW